MRTTPKWPNYFPKALPPNTITLEIQHINWGESATNIQSVMTNQNIRAPVTISNRQLIPLSFFIRLVQFEHAISCRASILCYS